MRMRYLPFTAVIDCAISPLATAKKLIKRQQNMDAMCNNYPS